VDESIGGRLRRCRQKLGLTQEQLAAKAGLSVDVITGAERGRSLPQTTTLMRLARALDVELTVLLDDQPRFDRSGASSVLAVRDVLLSPADLPGVEVAGGGEPTPIDELRRHVDTAWRTYWKGRFDLVTEMVPGLIVEARRTWSEKGPAAVGPLAQSYQLAACVLVQMGKPDLGALAAERALHAAHSGQDELQEAVLHGTYAWALLHQGRPEEAERVAVTAADRITPAFTAPADQVAVWGDLLMSALAPAAAAGQAVDELIALTSAGAERLSGPHRVYQTGFGPTTVAMQATHAYAVRREPAKALQAATRVRREDLRGISTGAHLLDVAHAQADARRWRDAESTLAEARDLFPLWFTHQALARAIVTYLLDGQRRMSPTLRQLARDLAIT
jgi:transcriptional regulator with XRE-family HTH domain